MEHEQHEDPENIKFCGRAETAIMPIGNGTIMTFGTLQGTEIVFVPKNIDDIMVGVVKTFKLAKQQLKDVRWRLPR